MIDTPISNDFSTNQLQRLNLSGSGEPDLLPKNLLCFSHLRWDFVYQRPQHLLTRFSDIAAVYFLEEPIFGKTDVPYLTFSQRLPDLWVCVPHLADGLTKSEVNAQLRELIRVFFVNKKLDEFIFWYYTPMALEFSSHLSPGLTVYDCMDELSAFKFAPEKLKSLEKNLLTKADIVFTGGHSLFESKKNLHPNIHPFPSSIDKKHFGQARKQNSEPADQAVIKGPKIGFYGVIDERFDIELIREIAVKRPDWNIVLIGPIVKIDPKTLPQGSNIHYLGAKSYAQLPAYLSGWDVAMVPFLLNESTRFISPTKTPEYLCAGKPVVSTPIRDVVNPYGKNKLVSIGKNGSDFIEAIAYWLKMSDKKGWLSSVDKFLLTNSWDLTCADMTDYMSSAYRNRKVVAMPTHTVSKLQNEQ
ncbi:glycosyltransferase [Dyadobacter fanqingshengii]|uniref:Glycosyltransferase n=1 Tax=Dyadobacter fanqingshengii TaxID=2906443 RepID=A0A9X1P967_9BACT|nr:glycosyltransferase [Dyadobacter fanqingshengii]MCF0040676.1 glycosyltransferase [Dyadobacter fanqingshengii]MCF2506215.1 glycosyltransferase [Dyadobacter fanqingshengii]USJ37586.1 glycosyltransferase [Dyadobacter fanqingshengii]